MSLIGGSPLPHDVTANAPSADALVDPEPQSALSLLERGFEAAHIVSVFGRCTVSYDGRAASELGPGDRHVLCKPDGTVLVHTDEGQQPVNWQPPGPTHEAWLDGDDLLLRSVRETPDERLEIRFSRVAHAAAFAVEAADSLALSGTEADLKARILEEPTLIEHGFTPLSTERDTPAGAVDVYGEDADGDTVVLELKRRRVGPDAVSQLRRYVDGLDRELHAETTVRGILVAPSVTPRAEELLAEHDLEFVSLSP